MLYDKDRNWLDDLLVNASKSKSPCEHQFVTQVYFYENIWQPLKWEILNTASVEYGHENIIAINKKDVFCKICSTKASEL